MSPHAVERLFELVYSADERVSLEACRAILDRHLGRPAIQADISLHRAEGDDLLSALVEAARRRALESVMLEDDAVEAVAIMPPTK
jgi:hypothetical protein